MITVMNIKVWDCGCEKCGHSWVSKNEIVPRLCPSCHRSTWNTQIPDTIDVSPKAASYSDPVLPRDANVRAGYVGRMQSDVQEYDYEDGTWSEEQRQWDGQTGEWIVYRKRLLKPFNKVEIRREDEY